MSEPRTEACVVYEFAERCKDAARLGLVLESDSVYYFTLKHPRYPEIQGQFDSLDGVIAYLNGFEKGLERSKPKTVKGPGMGSTGDGIRKGGKA